MSANTGEKMKIVIDSSSFFYGFKPDGKNEYFTTDSVLNEIRGKKMRQSIESLIEFIQVRNPGYDAVIFVKKSAKETGDLYQLSETDIGILALSYELKGAVLTNDLAIQNVCKKIHIQYESFNGKEISVEIEWRYRCIGCKRSYSVGNRSCPHCGNELKRYAIRRKTIP